MEGSCNPLHEIGNRGGGVIMDREVLENIVLNGISGVDGICDMIKDCIDSGDLEGAKDWIDQLNEEIYEGSQ